MENNTENTANNTENISSDKNYLKIINIRPFSNAYNFKLKENDIILAVDGNYFHSSYEDLVKILEEDKNEKIITIFRDGVSFNIKTSNSLGVTCENIDEDHIKDFKKIDLEDYFSKDKFFNQYEVYKDMFRNGVVLNLTPSILASLAPPLWMIYNRIWILFAFSIVFFAIMFYISPWLFFISWVLKSWYYGNNQINVLRNYYRFIDHRLFISICCKNEEEVQKKARELDPKIDFNFSYLDPPVKDEDLEEDPVIN